MSTALVTGAGQGMGAAIAARLARDGHAVAVNDINAETARATAERIGGAAYPFDVSDPDAAAAALGELGAVDVLVANHAYMTMAPFEAADPGDWARTIDVNLLGTATLIELVAPGMRERGFGRIVVIASEWGVIGWPNATAYAASKGGLIALVKSAARALGPHGVAVNAIAPGITDTPQLQVDADDAGISLAEMIERYAADVPLGRVGDPADIAEVVAFLCSEHAIALVGQVLQPNGGTTR
ncbi:MAG TPA: SDR family NAD(P)-dependent oxidoreductase [Solirubrobacteraceae bacterium]|nr:SDR family NAD(P)-dependent oxidoreductase [Solirubrobacteraceae bacterium]